MKIEKVNDNQIRCTLTKEDLADREIKLSELAYGTEKAKELFRDMMQMASYKFGFEAEDIPLMIEAIPLNAECIVLVVTKVEDPEELDTRFAKFAPSVHEDIYPEEDEDEYADLFMQENTSTEPQSQVICSDLSQNQLPPLDTAEAPMEQNIPVLKRLFSFSSIGSICELAKVLKNVNTGLSSVYKNNADSCYLLLLENNGMKVSDFSKLCNIVSEYGHSEQSRQATAAFLHEHYELIIKDSALSKLAAI